MPAFYQDPGMTDLNNLPNNSYGHNYSIKQVTIYSLAIIVGSLALVFIIITIVRCVKSRRAAKVNG